MKNIKSVLLIIAISLVPISSIYAKEGDINHVDDKLTVTSKDRTVSAGIVSIERKGPEVEQKGNTTIVDKKPKSYGIGITIKF